jgi:outer membrane receptor protein involved in Fe transport
MVEEGSSRTPGRSRTPHPAVLRSSSFASDGLATLGIIIRATNEYIGTMTDVTETLNLVPSRDIVRARVGWVSDRKVSAYLFVDNLFDKWADLGDPEEISFFVPALNRVMTNQPRTIGLELSYAWGGKTGQ